MSTLPPETAAVLQRGVAIPAMPLALTADRRFDDRRQRALVRYYLAAGAGGLAAGVHSTQFEIHDPQIGLLQPVLELVAEEAAALSEGRPEPPVRIAGVCGSTAQAVREAELARDLGYDAVLVSPAGRDAETLLDHYRAIGEVIPLVGFYLQRAVGGPVLPYAFWRQVAELDALAAIKVAAFDRYATVDVVRALAE